MVSNTWFHISVMFGFLAITGGLYQQQTQINQVRSDVSALADSVSEMKLSLDDLTKLSVKQLGMIKTTGKKANS